MAKVDAKGRIVLPQRVRERLGITTGSEVEVREEDGHAVVEPEDDPGDIVADLDELIESAIGNREQTPSDELDSYSKDHVEAIRRGADESGDE